MRVSTRGVSPSRAREREKAPPRLSVAIRGLVLVFALAGARPPIDFSGVWVLDERASQGVSTHMRGAVLSVEQTGDQIRILPLGHRDKILGDEIVADGRPYAKALGNGKGVVTAGWSKDRGSLWLEVTGGPPGEPRAAIQRSVWKLSSDRKTWVRHSISSSGGEPADGGSCSDGRESEVERQQVQDR